jgi:hypothetical protein
VAVLDGRVQRERLPHGIDRFLGSAANLEVLGLHHLELGVLRERGQSSR